MPTGRGHGPPGSPPTSLCSTDSVPAISICTKTTTLHLPAAPTKTCVSHPFPKEMVEVWCIHATECYSAIKRHKLLMFATTDVWTESQMQAGPVAPVPSRSRSPGAAAEGRRVHGGAAELRTGPSCSPVSCDTLYPSDDTTNRCCPRGSWFGGACWSDADNIACTGPFSSPPTAVTLVKIPAAQEAVPEGRDPTATRPLSAQQSSWGPFPTATQRAQL